MTHSTPRYTKQTADIVQRIAINDKLREVLKKSHERPDIWEYAKGWDDRAVAKHAGGCSEKSVQFVRTKLFGKIATARARPNAALERIAGLEKLVAELNTVCGVSEHEIFAIETYLTSKDANWRKVT